jgi:hypothetical protein
MNVYIGSLPYFYFAAILQEVSLNPKINLCTFFYELFHYETFLIMCI